MRFSAPPSEPIATSAISDPGILLGALDEPVSVEAINGISPWQFSAALSPHMAAAREGRSIDFDELIALCRGAIARNDGALFIEGVGGIMAPLDGEHTVLDWTKALGLPLIFVTGSYLGAISHTLTALPVLADVGLVLTVPVVHEADDGAEARDATCATLAG